MRSEITKQSTPGALNAFSNNPQVMNQGLKDSAAQSILAMAAAVG